MSNRILSVIEDYLLPAVVMAGASVIFFLAVIKAWELILSTPICLRG